VCTVCPATRVCIGDRLGETSPAFYCGDCEQRLHTTPLHLGDSETRYMPLYDVDTDTPMYRLGGAPVCPGRRGPPQPRLSVSPAYLR
jgi:hypothetical protein